MTIFGCCGCCAALRPRYKRLVDNIFPVNPQEGLVRSNMDKLTFYSVSSPEKLDRIGEYLAHKVSRDINRRRNAFVIIAMEAMDQLLVACHAQSLNLFVESFLKTVQKLLESPEPSLQILASQSFVKFANIEEDTPSYHRRYDFFVSKFASLCHNDNPEIELKNRLRIAGLRGIQGVVRKTVSDDLVENIWEPVHMDKIVPSLLYNMQQSRKSTIPGHETQEAPQEDQGDSETSNQNIDPATLAENCLRELVGRASFGNIGSVITPVFKHLDLHELWVPNDFAIYTFRVIMFSIQVQYSYAVVEILMSHLNSSRSTALVRTSMVDVLSKIIAIAAGDCIGPSVLVIVDSLLKHLKRSVVMKVPDDETDSSADKKLYQESLINALAEYANHLPDYQKTEIMVFILERTSGTTIDSNSKITPAEILFQHMLLKCLLKVSSKYHTVNYSSALPVSFLDPLLRTSLATETEIRLLVQRIFHCLIDRHENRMKLTKPLTDYADVELVCEKCSRADLMFYKNYGNRILHALSESLELQNMTVESIEAVFCTAALLCVELASDDTLPEMIRWAVTIQDVALTNNMIQPVHRALLHVVALSICVLLAHLIHLSELAEYLSNVVTARVKTAPYLLPGLVTSATDKLEKIPEDCLLEYNTISECLKAAGKDTIGMIPLQGPFPSNQRHSWAESSLHHPSSSTDLSAINVDVDSNASSPGMPRKHAEEEVTFETLKKVLAESIESRREAEIEKRQIICEKFRSAPFQQLVANSQAKSDVLNETLNQILARISIVPCQPESSAIILPTQSLPFYNSNFPDLFVY